MILFIFIATALAVTIGDIRGCWEAAQNNGQPQPSNLPYVEYEITVNETIRQVVFVRTARIDSPTQITVFQFQIALINGLSGISDQALGFGGYLVPPGTVLTQWLFNFNPPSRTLLNGRVAQNGQVFNLVLIRPSAGRPTWCTAGVPGTTAPVTPSPTPVPTPATTPRPFTLAPPSPGPFVGPTIGTTQPTTTTTTTTTTITAAATTAGDTGTQPPLLTLPTLAPGETFVFGTGGATGALGTGTAGDGGALGVVPVTILTSLVQRTTASTNAGVFAGGDGEIDYMAIGLGAGGGCLCLVACVVLLVALLARSRRQKRSGAVQSNYDVNATPPASKAATHQYGGFGNIPRTTESVGVYAAPSESIGQYTAPSSESIGQYTAPTAAAGFPYQPASASSSRGSSVATYGLSPREPSTSEEYRPLGLKDDRAPDSQL